MMHHGRRESPFQKDVAFPKKLRMIRLHRAMFIRKFFDSAWFKNGLPRSNIKKLVTHPTTLHPFADRKQKPLLSRVRISGGRSSRKVSRRICFRTPPNIRKLAGSPRANSTSPESRNGNRTSSPCCMLARSTFFSMSAGRLKRMSVTRRSLNVSMLRSDNSPGNDRSFEAGSPSAVSCLAEA